MTDRNRQLAPRALASSLGVPLKWCSISSGPQTTKQLPLLKGHRTSRKTLQHHLTPISLPRHLTPGLPIVSSKVRLKQFQPRLEPQRHALLHSPQRPNQKAGRETGCVRACVCVCVRARVCVCVCMCSCVRVWGGGEGGLKHTPGVKTHVTEGSVGKENTCHGEQVPNQ